MRFHNLNNSKHAPCDATPCCAIKNPAADTKKSPSHGPQKCRRSLQTFGSAKSALRRYTNTHHARCGQEFARNATFQRPMPNCWHHEMGRPTSPTYSILKYYARQLKKTNAEEHSDPCRYDFAFKNKKPMSKIVFRCSACLVQLFESAQHDIGCVMSRNMILFSSMYHQCSTKTATSFLHYLSKPEQPTSLQMIQNKINFVGRTAQIWNPARDQTLCTKHETT